MSGPILGDLSIKRWLGVYVKPALTIYLEPPERLLTHHILCKCIFYISKLTFRNFVSKGVASRPLTLFRVVSSIARTLVKVVPCPLAHRRVTFHYVYTQPPSIVTRRSPRVRGSWALFMSIRHASEATYEYASLCGLASSWATPGQPQYLNRPGWWAMNEWLIMFLLRATRLTG